MMPEYILAIDQGTSGTKCIIFDNKGALVVKASEPLKSYYSEAGFVEQDPEDIFLNVLLSLKKCIDKFISKGFDIAAIKTCGISNQRETFVLWDQTGKALCNAIVWQCKRSVEICERIKTQEVAAVIINKTGLIIDPYFSASKITWLVENNETIKNSIQSGQAYFGTIDTWLLYKLTGVYSTDYTNASRTMLFNLSTLSWDEELINIFGINGLKLPEVKPSSSYFGASTFTNIFPEPVSITAMIGDSHAAAFGEGCYDQGTAKATLGTGSSVLMNIGRQPKASMNGMVTTICWSTEERIDYALEGVIVSCGSTLEWLKNELQLIKDVSDTERIAFSVSNNNGVYLVPAFSGLGAPHWDMKRKGSVTGLTFGSTSAHIIRAALESIAFQVKDVIVAMEADSGVELKELMADGGISNNKFVLQFLANILQRPVVNIGIPDVSALGAAYLAGLKSNIFRDLEHLRKLNTMRSSTIPSNSNDLVYYIQWTHELHGYNK